MRVSIHDGPKVGVLTRNMSLLLNKTEDLKQESKGYKQQTDMGFFQPKIAFTLLGRA